jgi:dienelactone hydrolase
MTKLLPLLLIFCFSVTASAQVVTSFVEQTPTLAFILNNIAPPYTVDYNVRNYAVTYTTTDAFGEPYSATGLVVVPANDALTFPLAVYNHGTVNNRNGVLSIEGNQERFVAQIIAAKGFITLAPDYLGLGGGAGIHPYLHADTEASAARDMVIAVRAWLDDQAIARTDQVYVTGYSQGGHASMATHKLMEESGEAPSITAAAHLSGAYRIGAPTPAALAQTQIDPLSFRFALATLISYNFVYGLYGDLENLFNEPYLTAVNQYVSEEIDLVQMAMQVDTIMQDSNHFVSQIFSDAFNTDILDNDADLLAAYADNTVDDWAPTVPTLLFYCNGDEVVNPASSQAAFASMTDNGSTTMLLEDGGDFDHLGCIVPAAIRTIAFFQETADVFPTSVGAPADRPDIQISPNPVDAGNAISISGIDQPSPFVLYDQSGRSLATGETSVNGQVNLSASLPRGVLVIRVGLGDGTSVVRRIVVR